LEERASKAKSDLNAIAGLMVEEVGPKLIGKLGDVDFRKNNKLAIDTINSSIATFAKQDSDTYVVKIPLIGSYVDVNDLWVVSGIVLFFLLYFLKASLEQEYRNVDYILNNKSHLAKLVKLNQVVSTLGQHPNHLVAIFRKSFQVIIWLIPTYLYAYLLITDLSTASVGYVLLPARTIFIQSAAEIVTVALVIWMNISSLVSHLRLQSLIEPIVL
jgi:hypothetical protein